MLDQIKIATALTQTKIFCQKLEVDCKWVIQELEGYSYKTTGIAKEKLPKYRLLMGRFIDESNRPLLLDQFLLKSILPWPLVNPITKIQLSKDDDSVLTLDVTSVFEAMVKTGLVPNVSSPLQAKLIITNSDAKGLLEGVKNRLIEFLEELIDKSKTISLR